MKLCEAILVATILASCNGLFSQAAKQKSTRGISRELGGKGKGSGSKSGSKSGSSGGSSGGSGGSGGSSYVGILTLRVINLSYQQILSPFFVMAHNENIQPLYTIGQEAPDNGLETLAEDGDPNDLIDFYRRNRNTRVKRDPTESIPPGSYLDIEVPVSRYHPLVTIASMAISTNDCFVSVNGMKLEPGDVNDYPGLDSGTETNDELCVNIPGPPCGDSGNANPEGGEGFVHVHRGIQGVGNLTKADKDWRNPMMRVVVLY